MLWTRLGVECGSDLGRIMDASAQLVFDLVEFLRAREKISRPGRVHEAAFGAPVRLPQHPRYLGYWYDEARHVLIGMHLGLDINHSDGKYHIVECNTHPALKPERRGIYPDSFDPIIGGLVSVPSASASRGLSSTGRERGRRSTSTSSSTPRAPAASSSSVRASLRSPDQASHRALAGPAPAEDDLRRELEPRDADLPVHARQGPRRTMARGNPGAGRRSRRETGLHPHVRSTGHPQPAERAVLANLVVKLANLDGGEFVAMGRFGPKNTRAASWGSAPTGGPFLGCFGAASSAGSSPPRRSCTSRSCRRRWSAGAPAGSARTSSSRPWSTRSSPRARSGRPERLARRASRRPRRGPRPLRRHLLDGQPIHETGARDREGNLLGFQRIRADRESRDKRKFEVGDLPSAARP